jgi:hypothetical protein
MLDTVGGSELNGNPRVIAFPLRKRLFRANVMIGFVPSIWLQGNKFFAEFFYVICHVFNAFGFATVRTWMLAVVLGVFLKGDGYTEDMNRLVYRNALVCLAWMPSYSCLKLYILSVVGRDRNPTLSSDTILCTFGHGSARLCVDLRAYTIGYRDSFLRNKYFNQSEACSPGIYGVV